MPHLGRQMLVHPPERANFVPRASGRILEASLRRKIRMFPGAQCFRTSLAFGERRLPQCGISGGWRSRRNLPTLPVQCSRGPGSYRVVESAVRRVNQWLKIRERIASRRADNAHADDSNSDSDQIRDGRARGRKRRRILLRVKAKGSRELKVGRHRHGTSGVGHLLGNSAMLPAANVVGSGNSENPRRLGAR